jgi:hypothetical protein
VKICARKRRRLATGIRRQERHPAGVELDLVSGRAVGDRNCGRGLAEVELGDREASEGRVADLDPLAPEELAHLRGPDALAQEALNEVALGRAHSAQPSPRGRPPGAAPG